MCRNSEIEVMSSEFSRSVNKQRIKTKAALNTSRNRIVHLQNEIEKYCEKIQTTPPAKENQVLVEQYDAEVKNRRTMISILEEKIQKLTSKLYEIEAAAVMCAEHEATDEDDNQYFRKLGQFVIEVENQDLPDVGMQDAIAMRNRNLEERTRRIIQKKFPESAKDILGFDSTGSLSRDYCDQVNDASSSFSVTSETDSWKRRMETARDEANEMKRDARSILQRLDALSAWVDTLKNK